MIGFFVIDDFKDADGAEVYAASAHYKGDRRRRVELRLPPYLRPTTSDIAAGKTVFAVVDDVSGIGAALEGIDCRFEYRAEAAVTITGTVTASGDVKADGVSLMTHRHAVIGMPVTTGEPPVPVGTASGTTEAPTGG